MASADRELNALFQISRILKDSDLLPTSQVKKLYEYLFKTDGFRKREFELTSLSKWEQNALNRAVVYAENTVVLYTYHFYDPRVIPVTYYKREKRIRRHLDYLFSIVFKEIAIRRGLKPQIELIMEEPIFYLMQMVRERSFPKTRKKIPDFEILKSRFHIALSWRIEIDSLDLSG
jgi:hypothetical protein